MDMMNFVKNFKSLPTSSKKLLGLGVVLALAVALPLFIWAVVTQNFSPYNKAASPTPIPNLQTISINCANNGTTAMISWTAVQNAASYNLRLDYRSNNTSSCQDGWYCSDPPDKLIDGITNLSQTVNTINNSYYAVWVDSVGTDSGVLNRSYNYFVCNGTVTVTSSPTPTATPVATGAPNSCNGTCGSNYNCAENYFCFGGF